MSSTGDMKGFILKDPGNNFNYTYYGGRTEKSQASGFSTLLCNNINSLFIIIGIQKKIPSRI